MSARATYAPAVAPLAEKPSDFNNIDRRIADNLISLDEQDRLPVLSNMH
jgi:hypothetical protein